LKAWRKGLECVRDLILLCSFHASIQSTEADQHSMQIVHTPTPCQSNRDQYPHLCDQSTGSGALVSPGWWEDTDGLVVAGETVDTGLDENKTEFGVLVLSVALKMLANRDSLLDQHVQVLWDLWGEAI